VAEAPRSARAAGTKLQILPSPQGSLAFLQGCTLVLLSEIERNGRMLRTLRLRRHTCVPAQHEGARMAYLARIERPGATFYAIRGRGGKLLKWLGRNASAKQILDACRKFGVNARPVRDQKKMEVLSVEE